MNSKKKFTFIDICLAPFLFIASFIKHFFIGVKFVFFDAFVNIFEVLSDKNQNKVINDKKNTNSLIKEMQEEIKARQVNKEYYIYTGNDLNGNKVTGKMSATSKITLNNFLASEGITVIEIRKDNISNLFKKIGLDNETELRNKDLIFWLTQVSTYLKAGLTLNDTIKIMSKQSLKDAKKSKLYRSISYELTLGESFSTALQNQGKVFPQLLINMIKSAEATGDLIKTLDDMALYYTEIDKNRKEMISAIIYPTILLIFSISVLTFIMIFVIPEFIKVYASAGITVSGFTLTIINISNYLTHNIGNIILILLLILLSMLFLYRNFKEFRKLIQTIGMKLPFFGKIIIYHEITLFTKTFASLLKNSVFITNSMEILTNVTNNEVYKSIMIETISNIAKGEKISKSFENKWCIPDVAYYMIVTGESTSELSLMMEKVATYYNDLHKSRVTNLKAFLEPIMIVILALIVGIIILAVVVPMFSLYGQIK
ncbi:MAG: type II secretion system F family protein [Firmicutes bacterium]|nr:type II secretion system F family protein [Bacillota bacterium]